MIVDWKEEGIENRKSPHPCSFPSVGHSFPMLSLTMTATMTVLNLLEIQSVDGRIGFCRKGTTETRTANVRFIFLMSKKYDTACRTGGRSAKRTTRV